MSANTKQVAGGHYKTNGIQHWDLIDDNDVGYLAGNATKYLTRFRRKNGLQDLEKSLHYIEKMIEKYSNFGGRSGHEVSDLEIETFFSDNDIAGIEREPIRLILNWRTVADLRVAKTWVGSLVAEFDGSGAGVGYANQGEYDLRVRL